MSSKRWLICFEDYYENKSQLIELILEQPVFLWIKESNDPSSAFNLKPEDGFYTDEKNVLYYKFLCYSLSNPSAKEYFYLLKECEIDEVYEYLAISNSITHCNKLKQEQEYAKSNKQNKSRF